MNDDKLQLAIERGMHADRLANDELLADAFRSVEAHYISEWKRATDRDAREQHWVAVQVIGDVQQMLTVAINNGAMAKAELERRLNP